MALKFKILTSLPESLQGNAPYEYFRKTLEPAVNKKLEEVFIPEKIIDDFKPSKEYLETLGIYIPPDEVTKALYEDLPETEQARLFRSVLLINPKYLEKIKQGIVPIGNLLATIKHEMTHFYQRPLLPIKQYISTYSKEEQIERLKQIITTLKGPPVDKADEETPKSTQRIIDFNQLAYDIVNAPYHKPKPLKSSEKKPPQKTKEEILTSLTSHERLRVGIELMKELHAISKERSFKDRSEQNRAETENRYTAFHRALEMLGEVEKKVS